jgi:TatD DNase family protein
MLVDSHAHLSFQAYKDDLDSVLNSCRQRKMKVINVGSQVGTSIGAIKIAKDNDFCYASIGIHPIHLGEQKLDPIETQEHNEEMINFSELEKLASNGEVVAVGETGLDFSQLEAESLAVKQLQKNYFLKHLKLAFDKNLPVILHCRGSAKNSEDAYWETLKIIKEFYQTGEQSPQPKGVIHCFGSTREVAEEFISAGFLVGFTGIVTFKKKSESLQQIAKDLPLSKILIETDAPYLTPEPFRGKRNEPIYVEQVARKIAELKGMAVEEVVEITGNNAIELFNLK